MNATSKFNTLYLNLQKKLRRFIWISFGVFLYIIFFQPFLATRFAFNNRLLFDAGLGLIVLIIITLFRVIIPSIFKWFNYHNQVSVLPALLGDFLILAGSSIAFAFYLRYLGQIDFSFYIMFRIIIICSVPVAVLRLHDAFTALKQENFWLIKEHKMMQAQIAVQNDQLNATIEFVSSTGTDKLSLPVENVVFMKSANNYVEVCFKTKDNYQRQLIRNTLKTVEQQIRPYTNFIRCHRTCIVNIYYVDRLKQAYNNHWLMLKDYDEPLPVSRQYLLPVKERI